MHRAKLLSALIGCLVFVGTAEAADSPTRHLTGSIEPSGSASVRVSFGEKRGVEVRIYRFALRRVPMTCKSGATAHVSIKGKNVIRNDAPGRFGFGLGAVGIATGGARNGWEVAGRLARPSRARGTVRAFDTHADLGGGETSNCRSGLLPWSASGGGAG